jgi:predicted permease
VLERWLTLVIDADLADAVAGDLAELRARRGPLSFWRAAFGIALFLAWQRARMALRTLADGFGSGGGEWRSAFRSLRRSPWFAVTSVGVIALSMALATIVFAIVDGVLFKPLPYVRPNELHSISGAFSARPDLVTAFTASVPDVRAWERAAPEIEIATSSVGTAVTIADNDYLRACAIDRRFLDVIGVRPLFGGFDDADFESTSGVQAMLLSYDVWQRRFGGASDVIGRTLTDASGRGGRVAGVLPPEFVYPHPVGRLFSDALVPMRTPSPALSTDPTGRWLQVVARVPGDVSLESLQQRLRLAAASVASRFPVQPEDPRISDTRRVTRGPFDIVKVRPLREVLVAPTHLFAAASFAVAAGLLLLGTLNLASLTAGRALDRHQELALRSALGGSRARLLRLLAAEYAVIVIGGGVIGIGVAALFMRQVVGLLPSGIQLLKTPVVDARVVLFGIAASCLAIAIVTAWSARRATSPRLRPAMAAMGGSTPRFRSTGRATMIAAQVAIALVMTVAGALLSVSLVRVWNEDPGFDAQRTARIRLNSPSVFPLEDQNALLSALAHVPGVVGVGGLDEPFLERAITGSLFEPPPGVARTGDVEELGVTSGFFSAAGLRALEGRLPTSEEFDLGRRVIVVSRLVAAAYWPGQSAVGRTLMKRNATFDVIGVVADIRHASLDRASEGEIYSPNALQARPDLLNLLIRFDGDPGAALSRVTAEIRRRQPGVKIVRAEMLADALGESIQLRRFQAWLFGAFGGAALTIVGVGLFGTIAMSVARRTREVGIRMALGATWHGVIRLIIREQVPPVVTGALIGAAISAAVVRTVGDYLYRMTVYDLTAWTWAALLLVFATAAATILPAVRASRVDPVKALRVN